MIKIKTPEEIQLMVESGKIANAAMKLAIKNAVVGKKLSEIEKLVDTYIQDQGAKASFKTVDDYPYATCINVNHGIVHGIPNAYEIKTGDLISIDLGALYKGFHSDISYTLEIETTNETQFLEAGKRAINKALKQCRVGKKIGDISAAMEETVLAAGFTVSEDLVGHGIGRELHEDPYVPCYGDRNTGIKLQEGMVFAVEVIYQKGMPDIVVAKDNWTIETADKSLSGLFEKTVAISKKGPILITSY